MSEELKGKTVLVTGATAGIGKQTALDLAKRGAHVVIVGRNEEKTRQVVAGLKEQSGNGQVDFLLGDLSLLAQVRRVAADFQARFGALHVLINNVGLVVLSREETSEGHERTFATNHLGVFLLTSLLLPSLQKSGAGRVVTVSSDAHRGAALDFDDLELKQGYSSFRAYGRSKLMNILFTRELARRVKAQGITANALHPGMVASDFMKKPGVFGAVGNVFMALFGISVQKGAATSVYLASSAEVNGVTGDYFYKCKVKRPSKAAQDDETARRLWDVSEVLVREK